MPGLDSVNFQQMTRMYNNAISFTSLGAKVDYSVQGPMGLNIFKISGGLSHRISSLEPNDDSPGFAQIYVVGNNGIEEAEYRLSCALGRSRHSMKESTMKRGTILMLVRLMGEINPYAKRFRTALDVLAKTKAQTIGLQGVPLAGADPKRYNRPTVDEVGIVVQGEGDVIGERQIILHRKDEGLEEISDMHSSYFPLRYPIFFPYGQQQWDNLYAAWTGRGESQYNSCNI
jgi:hypothetical protein